MNLESSDLDLGIGYPVEQRDVLTAALAGHSSFKGERVTRLAGRMTEYAQWELATYARFCPVFSWVPIPELA